MNKQPHATMDIAFRTENEVFEKRLREVIALSGLSIKAFAPTIGRNRQTVHRWMTGESVPDADAVYTMCRLYRVSADWLLGLS